MQGFSRSHGTDSNSGSNNRESGALFYNNMDYRSLQDTALSRGSQEHQDGAAGAGSCRQLHGIDGLDFHSRWRTTQLRPAVFSLVNTVVGGGTLSLAYSFAKAGSVVGILVLALICVATDFSLFAMVSASRRTGQKSYEGVMKAAFGTPVQVATILFVFSICFLTPVAYLILLRGLLVPLVEAYFTHGQPISFLAKQLLMCAFAVALSPLTATSLGAIGSLAVFSMAAIVVLALVLAFRSYQCLYTNGLPSPSLLPSLPPSLPSLLSALPVFVAAFLCHFNLLPVFGELHRPTRERAHALVHFTMGATYVLYALVGLSGWAYAVCRAEEEGDGADNSVPDNILLAFPPDDPLVNVARAALVVVLSFCFPLLLIPCRDSLLRLVWVWCTETGRKGGRGREEAGLGAHLLGHRDGPEGEDGAGRREGQKVGEEKVAYEEEGGVEETPAEFAASFSSTLPSSSSSSSSHLSPPRSSPPTNHLPPSLPPALPPALPPPIPTNATHRLPLPLLTYLLLLPILFLAIRVDSVASIWAVLGSFACFAISFVLPPLAYLRVGCREQRVKRAWAWCVCVGGAILTLLCGINTVGELLKS